MARTIPRHAIDSRGPEVTADTRLHSREWEWVDRSGPDVPRRKKDDLLDVLRLSERWMSREQIAEELECSEAGVTMHMKELTDAGVLIESRWVMRGDTRCKEFRLVK